MLERDLPQKPDVYKQLLDQGNISPETYSKLVPPTNPDAPVVELTDAVKGAPGALNNLIQAGRTEGSPLNIFRDAAEIGLGNASAVINGLTDAAMPRVNQAQAETVLMPPTATPEAPVQLMNDGKAAPAPAAPQPPGGGAGASLMGALNQQKSAIMEGAKAGAEQASKEAAYMEKMADAEESMRATEAEREKQRQEKLNQYQQKLNDKMVEIESKPATISEKFANAGLGQKLMMGLGLFLGSAPNSSGQNRAVQVLQQEIDADIRASRADLENKKSIYQEMKDTFGDERQADAAARMAYLNNAQMRLDQLASQYKSPQIMANAKALGAKIEEEKAKYAIQFQQASLENPALRDADELTKRIMKLPKELQKVALEEKGQIEKLESQKEQLKKQWSEMSNVQSLKFRSQNPLQYNSLVKTFEAKLFPIVKSIVGERMTDADARILINSQIPQFLDDEKTRSTKFDSLISSLESAGAGRAPTLEGLGLLPKKKKFSLTPNE